MQTSGTVDILIGSPPNSGVKLELTARTTAIIVGAGRRYGVPIIMSMISSATSKERREFSQNIKMMTAPPPASVIASMEAIGIAVQHPDGYVEIRDRAKDVIISGGENISSIEVEKALYSHPAVSLVAVVAMPHEKLG